MKKLTLTLSGFFQWLFAKVQQLVMTKSLASQTPAAPASQSQSLAITTKAYATVVIPALNEAKRISEVVAYALADPATAEVIVIDDSSIDSTAELARLAGARVLTRVRGMMDLRDMISLVLPPDCPFGLIMSTYVV